MAFLLLGRFIWPYASHPSQGGYQEKGIGRKPFVYRALAKKSKPGEKADLSKNSTAVF
jgi:hypothetical protein